MHETLVVRFFNGFSILQKTPHTTTFISTEIRIQLQPNASQLISAKSNTKKLLLNRKNECRKKKAVTSGRSDESEIALVKVRHGVTVLLDQEMLNPFVTFIEASNFVLVPPLREDLLL